MDNEKTDKASIADVLRSPKERADVARRRLTAARVLTVLDKAIKEAEKKGDADKAARLRDRVSLIQGALDKASHLDGSDSSDDAAGIGGSGAKNDENDTEPEEQADSEDSEDSAEDKGKESGAEEDPGEKANNQEAQDEDGSEKSKEQGEASDSEEKPNEDESDDKPEKSQNSAESDDKPEKGQESADSDDADDDAQNSNSSQNSSQSNSSSEKADRDQENKNSNASGSDASDDSEDSEDSESSDAQKPTSPKNRQNKVYIDPFKAANAAEMQQLLSQLPPGTEIESLEDSLKRILSKLGPEAKEGAKAALQDRLSQLRESLTEGYAGKSIAEMSSDEFNDLINSSLDLANEVIKVSYSTDLPSRIKEIKADASNTLKNRELDAEDNAIINKERKDKIAANETEIDRYLRTQANLKSMQSFSKTIYRAIADQVDSVEDEEDSWSAIDRRHEDDPSIIVPGKKVDDLPEGEIPSVDLYIDQSASFDDRDVKRAKAAISNIAEFERRGEIKLNIYYFADHVYSWPEAARAEGGTLAWDDIIDNIIANNTKNVIIVSDRDLDYADTTPLKVDGIVCFLWKYGEFATEPVKRLQGRQGTYQYSFE